MSRIKRTVYPPGTMFIATPIHRQEKPKHYIAINWVIAEYRAGKLIYILPAKALSIENQTVSVHEFIITDNLYGHNYVFVRPE